MVEPGGQGIAGLDHYIQLQLVEAASRRVRTRGELLATQAARRREFLRTAAGDAGDPEQELPQLPVGDRPHRIERADRPSLRLDPGQGRVVALQTVEVGTLQLMNLPRRGRFQSGRWG